MPSKLSGLLDVMYRRACTIHNVVLNREHLTRHGISFNLDRILTLYQDKRSKNQANRLLEGITSSIRALGRKFSSKAVLAGPVDAEITGWGPRLLGNP